MYRLPNCGLEVKTLWKSSDTYLIIFVLFFFHMVAVFAGSNFNNPVELTKQLGS